jgi:UDP-N-acetylmuramoylalanine--D-glutamate ligase
MNWAGKKVAVLGWGSDTQDVEPWLKARGAVITLLDEKKDGLPFGDLSGYEVLVRSPGVYRYRPEIVEAEKKGVVVTSKTKIFFDVFPGKIIGVTGTKGKGTTSTLINEILKAAKIKTILGGNIGQGVFGKEWTSETWAIVELSSFQLVDLHKSPQIAVVLMVTSEHLDWHKNTYEYVEAKETITKFQDTNDFAIVNRDYENSRKIGKMGKGQKIWVSGKDFSGQTRLRGEHNKENIAAATAVAKILKIQETITKRVVENFKGLEHRLEEVATINGVTYFDDSFSTTPETTIAAIKSFTEPMILIAGGSEKGSDFTQLGKVISEAKNIKTVILVGKMTERINKSITNKNLKIIFGAKNMPEIIEIAKKEAISGDVVVLSPAAASFDMFKSYKDRGEQFKREVRLLNSI